MKLSRSFFALLLSATIGHVFAIEPDELRAKMAEGAPNLRVDTIADSLLEGFYQVTLTNGSTLQVTKDGEHFVYGDLYSLKNTGIHNYSEADRNQRRKDVVRDLNESEMIVFAPEGETKATITVFTDIDCGFCRKLHREVPELNRLGIAVRYLAYPRAGVFKRGSTTEHTPSYTKLMSSWCAEDPQLAITDAKAGKQIEEKVCENPIAEHRALGRQLKVTGTPALLYEDGRLEMGYKTADKLAAKVGIN